MKVIWVKAGGLVPLDAGGRIRSFHIARELAKMHQVTFFSFHAEESDHDQRSLTSVFHRVVTHPLSMSAGRGFGEAMAYLGNHFSPLPYSIAKYCKPAVARHLRKVLAEDKYDVILCDFLTPAPIVPFDLGIPVVVFTHNVEAMIWKRNWEIAHSPLWRFVFKREYTKIRAVELRYLGMAARVLTVSDADSALFAGDIDRAKIATIPTGVDTEYFHPMNGEVSDNIVFTGSMDWMPNEDGILYFVDEILPLIRKQRPQVRLWVVGRRAGKKVKALAEADSGIEVTGQVDDIRPYIAKGSVVIVPLRVGSGTRLKIFEAMAMGKAVVSTTIGAEGLPVNNGTDIVLADKPEQFASSVVQLLQAAEDRKRIGDSARALVEKRYSWAAVSRHLDDLLQSIA